MPATLAMPAMPAMPAITTNNPPPQPLATPTSVSEFKELVLSSPRPLELQLERIIAHERDAYGSIGLKQARGRGQVRTW